MPTLLLQLQGPMQSWGTTSRFDERDTQLEPSKSGVLGLLCAALGRDRREPVDDLAALRMGVRVDREGVPMRDYQTATGALRASDGKPRSEPTVVSPRFYLADAAFLVGLEASDADQLIPLHQALRHPVWPLALGRKGFVPAAPVYLPDGLVMQPLERALRAYVVPDRPRPVGRVRLVLEHPDEGATRLDQPIAPFSQRRFGPRFVIHTEIDMGAEDVPDPAAA